MPEMTLDKGSSRQATQEWISKSIEICMKEPIPKGYKVTDSEKPKWCAAKAYSQAREATGKKIGKEA